MGIRRGSEDERVSFLLLLLQFPGPCALEYSRMCHTGTRNRSLTGISGFEMIWCDFSSPSLRLVSRLNVTAPLLAAGDEDKVADSESDLSQAPVLSKINQDPTSYYPLPPQPTKTGRDSEPSHPAAPPNWRHDLGREPFLGVQGWGWFDSATWHYGSTRNGPGRGEVKAKVLSCGILSYYSSQFVNQSLNRALDDRKSLNLTADGLWTGPGEHGNRTKAIKQLARRRRFHHLGDVIPEEASLMREQSEIALWRFLAPDSNCSGADWILMTSEIVQRTTNHLTMVDTKLLFFPSDPRNETAVSRWLYDLRAQIHLFMVGYLEYPDKIGRETWSTQSELYEETYSRCKYRYTRLLVPEEHADPLPREEEDIRLAVEGVYGTICSVLLTLGFEIEQAWFDYSDGDEKQASLHAEALVGRSERWHDKIEELQAWLGWESEYYGCQQTCAWDERCYIPMWPLMHNTGGGPGGGPGRRPGNGTRPGRPGRGRGPPEGEPGHGPGGRHPPDNGGDEGSPRPPPPPPEHNGTRPEHPGFKMPPRGPWWMGDDTDLWEPKCVNIEYIMGQR